MKKRKPFAVIIDEGSRMHPDLAKALKAMEPPKKKYRRIWP